MQSSMIAGLFAAAVTLGGVASCVCLPAFSGDAREALDAVPVHSLPRLAPLGAAVEPTTAPVDLQQVLRQSRDSQVQRAGRVTPAIWVQQPLRAAPVEV